MEQWKRQEGTEPLFPTGQELVKAVTPPITPKEKRQPNYLLWAQLLICGLVMGGLLLGKYWGLAFYQQCKSAFCTAMEKETKMPDGEELLRFASAQVKEAAGELLQKEPPRYIGAGGKKPAKWPKTPAGYSEEAYQPDFELKLPISNFNITSPYGWRSHPISSKSDFHTGLDMAAAEGTPIFPAAEGIVIKATRGPSYGNNVMVLHQDGTATRYCHMQYIFVRQGEPVGLESQLGTVGCTGVATGPHLHLELLKDDIGYDPAPALGLG